MEAMFFHTTSIVTEVVNFKENSLDILNSSKLNSFYLEQSVFSVNVPKHSGIDNL